MQKLICFVGIAISFSTCPASADGLIHKLPADGSWASYDLQWHGPAPAGGLAVLRKGTMTVSSVGQSVVDADQCRWIEIRSTSERDGQEVVSVVKMLIPEKYLLAGMNPLGHVVKAWSRHPAVKGGTPQEITEFTGEQARPIRALNDMFFGLPAEIRMLDEDSIEIMKLGKLKCPGLAARYVLTRGNLESTFDYEVRLHDKAPFGVVMFSSASIHKEGGVTKVPAYLTVLRLSDFGIDARSDLPDQQ